MKYYKVPVTWEMYGVVEIEADSAEEAIEIARDDQGILPLPEGYYVDDSWRLSHDDMDELKAIVEMKSGV